MLHKILKHCDYEQLNTFILSLTCAAKILNQVFTQSVLIPEPKRFLPVKSWCSHQVLHVRVTNLIAHKLRLLYGNINTSRNETFSWENLDN